MSKVNIEQHCASSAERTGVANKRRKTRRAFNKLRKKFKIHLELVYRVAESNVGCGEYVELVELSTKVIREATDNAKSKLHIPTAIHSEREGYRGARLNTMTGQLHVPDLIQRAANIIKINGANRCHKTIVIVLNVESSL
ncbi:hypothetical protein DPMN_052537 [Dreissena polymorpha]|uniref:Uncharacterized protein n=1 Tax=Dreissena polymorpha TaxID=45954 RepID=A0A9D4CLN9_DREPO|nr:hypothetical protein DPMN_052537 [Dreissena polymorpha]